MDYSFVSLLCLSLLNSKCSCTDFEVSVSAAEGQDCELPCSGREGVRVSVLEWTRFDLDRELLVVREGKVLQGYEDPDYTNRVQLLDPQLTRGNLSVILKKVTLKDSGVYKCLILYKDKQEISQFIHLRVTRDTSIQTNTELRPRMYRGLFIGLSLFGLVAIIITVVALRRYANLKSCKRVQLFLFRHFCSEKPRDRSCHSVSSSTSTSTTTSTVSDSSTKALIHPDKKHLPNILRNSWNTLEPLPPFTHPLLPSSSPSSTLSRGRSDPALSGSDSDIDSKPTIPHHSSPDVCALV